LATKPLAGRGIVVTRPLEQAHGLASRIAQHGGRALLYPAIEIAVPSEPQALLRVLDRLAQADLAIFVSPAAVKQGMRWVRQRGAWPAGVRVGAVGPGSARELELEGHASVMVPPAGADSEALLALPELASVAGKRVVIFRGEGGRELLGDSLAARGAAVTYAACYRRVRPGTDFAPLVASWSEVHAVTVYSTQAVENLFALLGKSAQLLERTPLFVPHARIASEAAKRGVREVRAAGPGDEEMVAALVAYFAKAG
jgi:uroporphyrinogen-III synthase